MEDNRRNQNRSTPEDLKRPTKNVYKRSESRDIFSNDIRKTPRKSTKRTASSVATNGDVDLLSMSTRGRKKKKHNVKLICFNVFMSIILALSSLSLIGMTMLDMSMFKKDSVDQVENNKDLEKIVTSKDENVAYFLIAGMDLSGNLTDIMMVACYDLANNTMNILQLPRDTFIGLDVPTAKLNAVYGNPRKGESKIKALIRAINSKFGLPIDHYMTITIPGFRDVVDAIGGIEMTLDRKYTVEDSRPVDKGGKAKKITIGPGKVLLKGYEAEGFVRHRKSYVKGDLGRVEAQRSFYAAFAKKLTQMKFNEMKTIVTTCMDDISTDLSLGKMLGYAEKANKLDLKNIKITAVPGQSGTYRPQGGYARSYFSVHKQDLVDILNADFFPYNEKVLTVDDLGVEELHETYKGNNFEPGGSLDDFIED